MVICLVIRIGSVLFFTCAACEIKLILKSIIKGDVLIYAFCKKSSGKIVIFSEETLKKCQTLEIKKKKNIILSIKILFYQLNK